MRFATRIEHCCSPPYAVFSRTAGLLAACLATLASSASTAVAAQPQVGLGTTGAFALLAGSAATNTGPSTIDGNVGLTPGTSMIGFGTPATVNGTTHVADAPAGLAQSDLTTAYDDAAGRTPALAVSGDLGGLTLTSGVYRAPSSVGLTGPLTLDAQGDPAAVFIFQVGSSLTTASASNVNLINGAQPCNVYWQIGSSATLGTASTFAGNILALTSISMNDAVTVHGRALARNGAVTLINDTITPAACATTPGGTTPGGTPPGGTPPGGTPPGGTPPGATTPAGTTPGGTVGGVTVPGVTAAGVSTPALPLLPSDTGGGANGGGASGGSNSPGDGTALLTTSPRKVARTIAQFGVGRCIEGAFRATVTGLFIRRVVFFQDGHVIATRGKAPFGVLVGPGAGKHTVIARVTFTDGTPAAKLKLRFKSCADVAAAVAGTPSRPARRPPAFTG